MTNVIQLKPKEKPSLENERLARISASIQKIERLMATLKAETEGSPVVKSARPKLKAVRGD